MSLPAHRELAMPSRQRGLIGPRRAILYPRQDLIASFDLPLNDAGAGAVNLTLLSGNGVGTFTRATTKSTIGSTGLVLKGIGSGVAASYYDPTTLEYQGYFAEGARTNICLQSEDLATTWTNARSSDTQTAGTAPDGTNTANKLVEDATAANDHFINQALTFTNAIHTYSVWLKAGERTWARLRWSDGTTTCSAFFNLSTGAVGTVSNVTGATKAYPDGWYRCMMTSSAATAAAVGSIQIYIAEADNDVTFNGDGVSGIYVWGAQVEAGSFASSYIPTTTASVTRNADVLTYPFAGNADATQGWAYAELSTLWTTASGTTVGIPLSSQGGLLFEASAVAATSIAQLDGTTTITKGSLTSMATGVRKRASSYGGSTMSITGDGAAVVSGAFDGDHGSTSIAIGCANNGTLSWFGTFKNVRLGIIKPTDAQIQAMTA